MGRVRSLISADLAALLMMFILLDGFHYSDASTFQNNALAGHADAGGTRATALCIPEGCVGQSLPVRKGQWSSIV